MRQRFNFSASLFTLYDHLFEWSTSLHYQHIALIGPHAKRGYSINLGAAGWPGSLAWLQGQGRAWCLRGRSAIFLGGRRTHGSHIPAAAPSLIELAEKEQGWHWGQRTTSITWKVDGTENRVLYIEWFKPEVGKMDQGLCPWGRVLWGRWKDCAPHLPFEMGMEMRCAPAILYSPFSFIVHAAFCFCQDAVRCSSCKIASEHFSAVSKKITSVCLKISVNGSDYYQFEDIWKRVEVNMSSRNESFAGERLHLPDSLVLVIFLFWWHRGIHLGLRDLCFVDA